MNILLNIFIHLYGGPQVGQVESDVVEMEMLSTLLCFGRKRVKEGRMSCHKSLVSPGHVGFPRTLTNSV